MPRFSRRGFLGSALVGSAAPYIAIGQGSPTPQDVQPVTLRNDIQERVNAGRQTFLDEVRPTRSQLERGLDLHYSSYVVDLMGALYVSAPVGHIGKRLQGELDRLQEQLNQQGVGRRERKFQLKERWRQLKTFESAFDTEWKENYRSLYRLTGLDLAVEDNASHYSWRKLLRYLASSNLIYSQMADVFRVTRLEKLEETRQEGKLGVISCIQGVTHAWVEGQSVANLELLYGLGVRIAHLTHGERNAAGSDSYQLPHMDRGLTLEGKRLVRRMNELGVLVDLAHAARRTALDAVESSDKPVVNSHTGCEAVFDDRDHRNVDDEYLKTLADKGGLVGIYVWPGRLSSDRVHPNFDDWARHLEHAVKVVGIENVGIGTDVSYLPHYPPHAMDWTNFPYWTVGLVCRGFSDQEIRQILGENFLRLAPKVLNQKPWGRFL